MILNHYFFNIRITNVADYKDHMEAKDVEEKGQEKDQEKDQDQEQDQEQDLKVVD